MAEILTPKKYVGQEGVEAIGRAVKQAIDSSTGADVIKTYVDTQDNNILTSAKAQADEVSKDSNTVNGHTVEADVPASAVFTDTTYSPGTGLSLSGTTFNHSNSITAGTAKGDDTKTLTFGGTFTVPTVTYDAQGHITGKGTTTMTMPANPNTDTHYTTHLKVGASSSATANAAATNGNVYLNVLDNTTVRDSHNIVGSGATTVVSDADGKVTISSTDTNTKVTSVDNHYSPSTNSSSALSASASGATAAWSIDVVKGVTLSRDAKGHVTGVSVTSGKIPANPNTDTKVTNTLATTTKAYITGTTSSSTNTGTQVFDTGVYLDTTAGQLVASTFKGALSGNADTATALTTSAGTAHIPVRFSSGKPVAVSEILKYNTGSLSHGDNTISYASGYKYALIILYCFKSIANVSGLTLQPVIVTWAGNMSSTTSYDEKTISQSNGGQYDVTLTVSNGDIILNINGTSYYRYLIIWSN